MPNKVCVWILVANLGLALSELKTIVDLTWDFSNETIYWTGISPFKYTKVVGTDERGYWYSMNEFCAGEHGGTHFDAPYHFSKEGWKVADVPIERLIAQGATIDLSHNDTKTLLPQHLDSWVRLNGEFENNTILLVRFGWSRFWPNRTQYMGVDSEGKVNFPGLSVEAATWIAQSGKIVGVGVDTASVDPGASTDYMAHRTLSKSQIFGMENVKMVEELPAKGFTIVALPMKLKEGTGGPLRVLAVPNNFLTYISSDDATETRSLKDQGISLSLVFYQPLLCWLFF